MRTPIHIIVSRASSAAIEAIERAGGSVTTRYYTPDSIKRILAKETHPVHSRHFRATPLTNLVVSPDQTFEYALPDPTKRKDLEYYRDAAHRGYLSYQVPEGHGPSLFFRTPGKGISKTRTKAAAVQKVVGESKLW